MQDFSQSLGKISENVLVVDNMRLNVTCHIMTTMIILIINLYDVKWRWSPWEWWYRNISVRWKMISSLHSACFVIREGILGRPV